MRGRIRIWTWIHDQGRIRGFGSVRRKILRGRNTLLNNIWQTQKMSSIIHFSKTEPLTKIFLLSQEHQFMFVVGPFWDKKDDPLGAMQNLIDDQADEISELRDGCSRRAIFKF